MEATITRADILAEAARRYGERFRDRLVELYALPEDPYEPEEEEINIVQLVLILKDFRPFEDSEPVAQIADELTHEFQTGVVARSAPVEGDELASLARIKGVRL